MPKNHSRIEPFLEWLACPYCGAGFFLNEDFLQCSECDNNFPIVRGVPRFTDSDSYVASFSTEWLSNRETQLARRVGETYQILDFEMRSGLKVSEPPNVTLEAGCGAGRHTELLARRGWKMISTDLSLSVESAYANLKSHENILVIQADLNSLPIKYGSVDAIFSLGVIHHTPNPRKSFASLRRHLKPGGRMSISVYSDEGTLTKMQNRIGNLYRFAVKGTSPATLYRVVERSSRIVRLPAILYKDPLRWSTDRFIQGNKAKLNLVNVLSFLVPPMALLPDPQWRILNTFDYLSPRFASKHTYSEVLSWFKQEGFEEARPLPIPVSVTGTL
jgi:SAM-dependent methyltransferase